ncbi:Tho complex subunit 7 domain containing protein [Elaphomyces granulatus]
MTSYAPLDQAEEDSLHKSRLLNVEEKPFKRITKRLLTPNSLVSSPVALLPTPPPDPGTDGETASVVEAERQKKLEEWRQFREDVTLDFAAFESSIARIQFLLESNEKERARYATENLRIQSTAQAVRANTTDLHSQLEEAQRTLALRKTYDELAEKITSNRLLRPREDQEANLQKLQAEILELEKESREYAKTWSERREQFGRIVEEGMQLRRLIRDEKEEVERREGMQEGEDGDDGDIPSKGRTSSMNTPHPDQDHDGATPSHPGHEESSSASGGLHVNKTHPSVGTASPLRQSTTASEKNASQAEDTTMVDEGEVSGDEDTTRTEKLDDLEEGEEISDEKMGDRMDTG